MGSKLSVKTDIGDIHLLERGVALEGEAREGLENLLEWNRGEAQGLPLHEVERGLLRSLLRLGLTLLRCHLAKRGIGKEGGEVRFAGCRLPSVTCRDQWRGSSCLVPRLLARKR